MAPPKERSRPADTRPATSERSVPGIPKCSLLTMLKKTIPNLNFSKTLPTYPIPKLNLGENICKPKLIPNLIRHLSETMPNPKLSKTSVKIQHKNHFSVQGG